MLKTSGAEINEALEYQPAGPCVQRQVRPQYARRCGIIPTLKSQLPYCSTGLTRNTVFGLAKTRTRLVKSREISQYPLNSISSRGRHWQVELWR